MTRLNAHKSVFVETVTWNCNIDVYKGVSVEGWELGGGWGGGQKPKSYLFRK